jgi:hypothetical protein
LSKPTTGLEGTQMAMILIGQRIFLQHCSVAAAHRIVEILSHLKTS